MKLAKHSQKMKETIMSTRDRQADINVSEVFHLWSHLVQRYHIIYLTEIYEVFAQDDDLKVILNMGKKDLAKHISVLEQEMAVYGIPLPERPPKEAQNTVHVEAINDRYIFRRILRGIQSFLPTHTMAFVHSTSPKIRELFMNFLFEEMKIYDKFIEYGKLKGYTVLPPVYKT